MIEETVVEFLKDILFIIFRIVLPIFSVSLAAGIIISIFQAATSIQEMTLTFVPKILVTAIAIIFMLPWMIDTIIPIANKIFAVFSTIIKL